MSQLRILFNSSLPFVKQPARSFLNIYLSTTTRCCRRLESLHFRPRHQPSHTRPSLCNHTAHRGNKKSHRRIFNQLITPQSRQCFPCHRSLPRRRHGLAPSNYVRINLTPQPYSTSTSTSSSLFTPHPSKPIIHFQTPASSFSSPNLHLPDLIAMASDAESVLREKLKVALQDARQLFDDGLVDEKEFKDLKTHELTKYKEQLAAITATTTLTRPIESTPPAKTRTSKSEDITPMSTPLTTRLHGAQLRHTPSDDHPGISSTPPSQQQSTPRKRSADDLVYLPVNTFKRLATPPIFRRRAVKKRRVPVPSAELEALTRLQEENQNLHTPIRHPSPHQM